jgi:peptidoglycan hydrolase FlgJ
VINIRATNSSGTTPVVPPEQRLKEAVGKLEGVFVQQLFKAMRETVPQDGLTSGGAGEDMFSGMLDQHFADAAPGQWHSGIGNSLLHQLRPALQKQDAIHSSKSGTK